MAHQDVVVYVSDDCEQCDHLLSMLERLGVDYQEKNTTLNREYMRELQNNRIYSTPATFINEDVVLGFQKNKLKQKLGIDYRSIN